MRSNLIFRVGSGLVYLYSKFSGQCLYVVQSILRVSPYELVLLAVCFGRGQHVSNKLLDTPVHNKHVPLPISSLPHKGGFCVTANSNVDALGQLRLPRAPVLAPF